MIIVSNTSPILNLAVIGQLDLLKQLYKKVIIPEKAVKPILDSLVTKAYSHSRNGRRINNDKSASTSPAT